MGKDVTIEVEVFQCFTPRATGLAFQLNKAHDPAGRTTCEPEQTHDQDHGLYDGVSINSWRLNDPASIKRFYFVLSTYEKNDPMSPLL